MLDMDKQLGNLIIAESPKQDVAFEQRSFVFMSRVRHGVLSLL